MIKKLPEKLSLLHISLPSAPYNRIKSRNFAYEVCTHNAHPQSKIMQKETMHTSVRHWLRDGLTLLLEALTWTACLHIAARITNDQNEVVQTLVETVLAILLYVIAVQAIPANTFSRTARRDEIVACATKTALIVCAVAAIFDTHHWLLVICFILFATGLAIERLILNSWFIRYAMRHPEHGVIICSEETAWQQQALQQNTYGLKLSRLEVQTAQQLEAHIAAHPNTKSVYVAPTCLPESEFEDVAHTCRKLSLSLHILPLPLATLPQTMQNECRGSVCVLSPARLPLNSIPNRMVKRLTDIVLSLLVLLTVFPLFALVAYICIKRQSRGPVIMTRHMCGMNGKTFQCLTFRTRHFEAAPSFFEGTGDPGYFPFGKFLSASRLELLPQFLCVLWGSMTIVGSQMMQPERYPNYRRELRQSHAPDYRLKAGITSYHLTLQSQGSTKADIWYYRNWGFWLDTRIMLQRLATLLRQSKAKSINYI